jgi:hypothetical protein
VTQGIVSIRKNGAMVYKIIVGAEGMNAPKVASRVRSMARVPTVLELMEICRQEDFDPDYVIILEDDPEHWNKPKLHLGPKTEWDEGDPKSQRYFDTFHVAQFNPRWRFGTADYVEVVDFPLETKGPDLHLWTDEEVADLTAKGIISTEPPNATKCPCGKPVAKGTMFCDECHDSIPF